MGIIEKDRIVEELKKHKLCQYFWSDEISEELEREIRLTYEPVGDMGIYSKYFEFYVPYNGKKDCLLKTNAVIKLGITANTPDYDIHKAIEGIDFFHNVKIKVVRDGEVLLSSHFRLWSEEKEEYRGSETLLDEILHD